MAAKSQDKVLFGAAVCLLLACAGWMALQNAKLSALRTSSGINIAGKAYVPSGVDAPTVNTQTWPSAPSQSSGKEWVYDVFTPPEIYYDAVTKKFTATPPNHEPPPPEPPAPPFGVELLQVRQDAFRLQLVGYVGAEGDFRGTFQNMVTGDTVIGRAGKKFPDLGLTIKTFEVKHNRTKSNDNMDIYDTEATAVVVDDKTGEEIPLTNKRRLIKGEPLAVLKAGDSATPMEYKAGAKFTVGTTTYTVVNVTFEPPSAEILKESPDLKSPVTKTLTPGAPVAPVPASPVAPAQPAPTPFPFGT